MHHDKDYGDLAGKDIRKQADQPPVGSTKVHGQRYHQGQDIHLHPVYEDKKSFDANETKQSK